MNDDCFEMRKILKSFFFIAISLLFLYFGHLILNKFFVFLVFLYFLYLGAVIILEYLGCLDDYDKHTKL